MPGMLRGIHKDTNTDIFIKCSVKGYNSMVREWFDNIRIDTDLVTRAINNLKPDPVIDPDPVLDAQKIQNRLYDLFVLVKNKISGAHIGYMEETTRPKSKNAVCCVCGEKATGRCSGCDMVFYCSKEHQTDHRNEHKCFCRLAVYHPNLTLYRMLLEPNTTN